jgi:hypothetical protein
MGGIAPALGVFAGFGASLIGLFAAALSSLSALDFVGVEFSDGVVS